jgi:RNA polymerase sigma factor (sigma-70 family)
MRERESERSQRFDRLFADYGADIVAYCGWRAGSPHDAQDAVADVFLTAWRRLDELPEGDAARVWLYATARRVIANHRRSKRRRAALQERLALEAAPPPQDAIPFDRAAELVHEALYRLGPRDREVLLLAEWEGALDCADRVRSRLPHRDRPRPAPPSAASVPRGFRGAP